jgi:hypothetical protein
MLPISELTVYANQSADHQRSHAHALADGLARHGIKVEIRRDPGHSPPPTKHVACWGWRMGQRLRKVGAEVLVMERGYLGDRFAWTSLGWNGLNGRATFYAKDDPSRFGAHFGPMRQWKLGGKYVLLIGQVPGDQSLGGMDLSFWYARSATQAAKAYGLPVRFRPHPMAVSRGIRQVVKGAETIGGDLEEALSAAAICITFNSNTGVDAVLAGVPTIAADRGTMAYEVTARTIGERFVPDREQWASRLAWCQWTIDEIATGLAWEVIRPS